MAFFENCVNAHESVVSRCMHNSVRTINDDAHRAQTNISFDQIKYIDTELWLCFSFVQQMQMLFIVEQFELVE